MQWVVLRIGPTVRSYLASGERLAIRHPLRLRIAHWELNIGQILGLMRAVYCQVIFARALGTFPPYFATGSGRIWKCITIGGVPFPVSMWNGVRVLVVVQSPRPFQPACASSMRPSSHFEYVPIGYGTRSTTHFPSFSA